MADAEYVVAIADALRVPVTPSLSPAAQALGPSATPAQQLTAALVESCDPAWFTLAASNTAALVAAGIGTAGVKLAVDQTTAVTPVRTVYVAYELSYPYVLTFGVRAG